MVVELVDVVVVVRVVVDVAVAFVAVLVCGGSLTVVIRLCISDGLVLVVFVAVAEVAVCVDVAEAVACLLT